MRVYLPATLPLLRQWRAAGAVPAPTTGFAVTPALRAADPGADEEELEYAATALAAEASARLPPAQGDGRRVVLAVDADAVVRDHEPGAVEVVEPVPWRAVAAGLVGADGRSAGAELLWYATQELGDL